LSSSVSDLEPIATALNHVLARLRNDRVFGRAGYRSGSCLHPLLTYSVSSHHMASLNRIASSATVIESRLRRPDAWKSKRHSNDFPRPQSHAPVLVVIELLHSLEATRVWGGQPQLGANEAELLKEMRSTLRSNFGLGVVIPAQYQYMKSIDTTSLKAQVDWLTILAYDLHGAWDVAWIQRLRLTRI
jgi:hypothetical protein